MALYIVRLPVGARRKHFSVIVDAGSSGAAVTAAMAESSQVKATWEATLLSGAVPARIYGDAILPGERRPNQ